MRSVLQAISSRSRLNDCIITRCVLILLSSRHLSVANRIDGTMFSGAKSNLMFEDA